MRLRQLDAVDVADAAGTTLSDQMRSHWAVSPSRRVLAALGEQVGARLCELQVCAALMSRANRARLRAASRRYIRPAFRGLGNSLLANSTRDGAIANTTPRDGASAASRFCKSLRKGSSWAKIINYINGKSGSCPPLCRDPLRP